MPVAYNVRTHMEQIVSTVQWFGAPVAAAVISLIYFVMAKPLVMVRRLAVSAHGVLLLALYLVAAVIHQTGSSNSKLVWPF
jgi:hypothetical protein